MSPFDLSTFIYEWAKLGHTVVTRTGDKAKFLTDELHSGLVAFLVCGRVELYNKDGTYYDNAGGEHHLDLFMA